jgi:hypothetical protein
MRTGTNVGKLLLLLDRCLDPFLTSVQAVLCFGLMELRRHSLMSYRVIRNWPPEWIWADGFRNVFIHPKGEIGVLESARQSIVSDKCLFITMLHQRSTYLGRVNFDHEQFCRQIFELLKAKS